MTAKSRLGAGLTAAAVLLLPWMNWRALGQPSRELPDPPIIIGDGSILIQIGKEKEHAELIWKRWTYHAPQGHENEALIWSAPGNRTIRGIKEKGTVSAGMNFRRLGNWGGLLVVHFTDGTTLQVGPRDKGGKGLTLVSSRPFRDFRAEDDRTLRFGNSTGPHITEAYLLTSGSATRFCREKKPGECTIEIDYR